MNFISRLFTKKHNGSNELPEMPQWVKDSYRKREERNAFLKSKYLRVVESFDFDKYSVFSELCKSFRQAFTDEAYMDFDDIAYCEYALKLSPKTKFTAKRLDGEVKVHKRVWERGISTTCFYDPPILIGDVTLRPGYWEDNNRIIYCFQIIKTCNKCGNTISGDRCYGLATIGHYLIYDSNDYHDCLVKSQRYQEKLTREAIERLVF